MFILRLFFVALVVAMASAQINDAKPEPNAYCICNNGDTGTAWFGGCHSGYAYCGNQGPVFTVCCKKLWW